MSLGYLLQAWPNNGVRVITKELQITDLESQLLDFSKHFSANRREMNKTLADAGVAISELQVKLDDIKKE